jgi:phosphatidylserine decarboxylase
MNAKEETSVQTRYQNHFGYIAGYLPRNRESVDEWQRSLKEEIGRARAKGGKRKSRAVEELAALIERNGIVRMYVQQMLDEQPQEHKTIGDIDELLRALDHIIRTAPVYNQDPSKINAFPMSTLFTYMMMTPAGEAIMRQTEFNGALRKILQEWCSFLNSPASASVLNEGKDGWLSQSAFWYNKLYEFEFDRAKPHWGWKSYNDFFHRQIKPEARPIADPDNPKVIVSANDGTVYNIEENAQPTARFWLKGQPYSLLNMLDNEYVERFVGGTVFQSFLSGANYHRWRSPIEGVVRHARVVDGLMFSDVESAGVDLTAATYSQGYETCVNTRALVFIESPDPVIGMVCVIPIGITEISSVVIEVKEGDKVRKGDELGYFSYGGSGMALVFQPGAVDQFTVPNRPAGTNPDEGPPIRVNAQIALGR